MLCVDIQLYSGEDFEQLWMKLCLGSTAVLGPLSPSAKIYLPTCTCPELLCV